jgi:enoyl-CoA hydratase
MTYQYLKPKSEGNIEILTISNPSALNALNSNFFKEFNSYLDYIESNEKIRVLIITGDGKAFVAGADISEMKDMSVKKAYQFSEIGQSAFSRLEKLKIPVIAAVNGFALGGGMELALACDFRIASSKAKFGLPEVSLGLIPGYGGTQRLARLSNLGNALFMQLTGDMISANDALRMNIVQKVVEPEELLEITTQIAQIILQKGPNATRYLKGTVRKGFFASFEDGLKMERDKFCKLFDMDGREGMKAFLEKRKANW